MSISPTLGFLPPGYTLGASRANGAEAAAAFENTQIGSTSAAEQEFLDYARKTPAERMREAILKELDLTEEDLERMPPEQRREVEALIKERIKDEVEKSAEEKTGVMIDITA